MRTMRKSLNLLPGILLIEGLLCFFVPLTVLADSFDGQVVRALFSTKIKKGVPVNEVLILENNVKKIYFYSDVKNINSKYITHTWEHRGEKVYEKRFELKSKSSRFISSYQLDSKRTGEWMVIVRDDEKRPIKAVMFKYVKKGSFAGKGIIPVSWN